MTRKVIFLNDVEIIELTATSTSIFSVTDGIALSREPEIVVETMEAAKKGGFDHFMLKEIHEQPQVAKELLHLFNNSTDVDEVLIALQNARMIYFIGCGTSYNACVSGAVFFNKLANRAVIPIAAPQFSSQYDASISSQDVGIFVSQSGETKDVLNAVEIANKKGMKIFSLVNVVGSTLTKKSEKWLPLTCGYEISVPATKTFTNQLIAFLYLAYRLGNKNLNELELSPQFNGRRN